MYAQVATDYDRNALTLIRGHGYPVHLSRTVLAGNLIIHH